MCSFLEDSNAVTKQLEIPGIEPGAFHMQSERATTALYPLLDYVF